MSESSDEEGKSMKNAGKKEEEEYDAEEKYDDGAEKKEDDVNPPSTKRKHVDLESCDQRSRNVIPKSKEIKSSTRVDNKEEEDFVFEVQLSFTDFQSQKLTIPWETVEKYFLDADTRTQPMIRVLLTDKYNDQKHVRCSFSPQLGRDFIITEWSGQFGPHKAMDLIRFYKPLPQPSHYQHYLIGYLKFLFEKTLTTTDVSQKLFIPIKVAENHFPRLITNKPSHAMLQISDAQNMKWEMKFHVALVADYGAQRYRYKMDWTEFVTKHKLEAGDVISFYKPVLPSEDNHYAIRFKRPSKKDDSKNGGNKDIHPEK
ncbi:AP2/ERF and B3 domain-containing protein Os01g0693400 [Camellia lanceoleosa]|uniref:AP2/ERF and B3 domain-containing protein Os01g0693400 n=1 Tax=Camellia lanceoleosa TaxID=1840588 RepID=A0ACC0F1C5_9ERIC|nr:AP2/ERF and B3 domain-containing protein Os01g0693400 [Camellia lanceoleosa]